jgi:hypothetical protein
VTVRERHPTDDCVTDAAALGRHRIQVEPAAFVADEDLSTAGKDLREHEHCSARGMTRRVPKRFERCRHQRFAGRVQRPITDRGQLDGDPVLVLDARHGIS